MESLSAFHRFQAGNIKDWNLKYKKTSSSNIMITGNWYLALALRSNTVWNFLKRLRIKLPYYPAILLSIYLENLKTLLCKDICSPMFMQHDSLSPRHGNNLGIPQQMTDKEYVIYILYIYKHTHTMEYFPAIKKMKYRHLWQPGWIWRLWC